MIVKKFKKYNFYFSSGINTKTIKDIEDTIPLSQAFLFQSFSLFFKFIINDFPKTIKIQEGLAPRMRPDHRLVDFTNADPNIHSANHAGRTELLSKYLDLE